MSTASLIALSAQATRWAPCICSAISPSRARSSSGSPPNMLKPSPSITPDDRAHPPLACLAMSLPPPSDSATALVTGASSGIGAAIAAELAGRGYGVTLVARREDRLNELAEDLAGKHVVRAETIGADLEEAAAREAMAARIGELGLEVEILVNNAGFGY